MLRTGTFISVLDFFIVNVAVPSIQRDPHITPAGIEWVVAGFALAYGSGLLIGGRLGDLFGGAAGPADPDHPRDHLRRSYHGLSDVVLATEAGGLPGEAARAYPLRWRRRCPADYRRIGP